MSIANDHTHTFYIVHFEFKDPVNAIYIIAFWDQWPCSYAKNFLVYVGNDN